MDLDANGIFDLRDIVVLCTAITVIIGATLLVTRQILKPIGRWVQRQFQEAVTETIAGPLEEIRHEVTSNDGGSLKDAVKKNHAETLTIFKERDKTFARIAHVADQRVKTLEDSHTEILGRLDELGNQSASDSAAVIHKLDHPTTEEP